MKNKILFGGVMMLFLTGCNTNDFESIQKFNSNALNIISSVENGATVVTTGTYTYDLNVGKQEGTVSTSNLIFNNATVSFTTEAMNYASSGPDAVFTNINATTSGVLTLPLTGNILTTSRYYLPASFGISSPYNPAYGNTLPLVTVGVYNLGNSYVVKTFQPNTFWVGKTTTTYPFMGVTETYETEDILYGLILKLDKEANDNKADILMYNAKFSNVPQEPIKALIMLKDLPVSFDNGRISISATDVIPEIAEGTQSTPYPTYVFNTLTFNTTNEELSTATFNYQVAGMYNGTFSGKYVITPKNTPNN